MLEQAIRHYYQSWFVDPVVLRLHKKIKPLHITLSALFTGLLILPALLFNHVIVATCLLLFSGYLDTLDGSMARYTNSTTALGTIYDILVDRIVEFVTILGLWMVDPAGRGLLCILMLGSILLCITSFLVVGIFTPNDSHKGFHYSPGLIERAEAFIFFALMILLPTIFTLLAIVFILLVTLTTIIRLYEFKTLQTL